VIDGIASALGFKDNAVVKVLDSLSFLSLVDVPVKYYQRAAIAAVISFSSTQTYPIA
jgi:hypothetical protein